MFDLDESFHALQSLDSEGRKALVLAGKVWQEVHGDALSRVDQAEYLLSRLNRLATDLGLDFDLDREKRAWELLRRHPVTPLTKRYLAELSELTEEVRVLRERLADALDGREAAESQLERVRALATHWGLDTELDRALADWRPHCRRQPRSFVHEERIDLLEEEVRRLQRESKAAREAEYLAIDRMKQERARAEAAEQKCNVLRSEIRALYYRRGRP
jgi:polyhydroxyalkanoate synthesis regulator phasin